MLQVVTYNLGGAKKLRRPPLSPITVAKDACTMLTSVIDPHQPTFIGLQEITAVEWVTPDAATPRREDTHITLRWQLGQDYRSDYLPILNTQMYAHAGLWDRDAYIPGDGSRLRYAAEGNGMVSNMAPAPWPWKLYGGFDPAEVAPDSLLPIITQISNAQVYSTGNRNTEPRFLMVASIHHPTYGDLFVLNTHIGTITGEDRHNVTHPRSHEGEGIRVRQTQEILRVLHELRTAETDNDRPHRPVILVGDFNATPDSAPIMTLREEFDLLPVDNPPEDRWTHTVHELLIDHVLVNDPEGILPPGRATVLTDGPFDDLSDHRAVVAIFE